MHKLIPVKFQLYKTQKTTKNYGNLTYFAFRGSTILSTSQIFLPLTFLVDVSKKATDERVFNCL